MYKKKGAQITVFLLIGIVLIVIFSVLFFVYNNSQDQKDDENKQLQYSDLLQNTAIKSSINSCFDAEIIRSLNFLAKQGGSIYKDQGGNYEKKLFLNYSDDTDYTDDLVNYGITRREPNAQFFPKPVPEYPYAGKLEKTNFPYFGKDNIPGLCDPFGSNKNCPSYDVFDNSFEKQLYISVINGTKKCLRNTLIHTTYPAYSISVSDEPNLTIKFGEKSIIFDLKYKIDFVFSDKVLTGVEEFKITKDIRMKHIHNFLKELITNEIKNIKFDIVNDIDKLKTFKPGLKVSKVSEACTECTRDKIYDDIIKVSDEFSLLGGYPYEFLFARQNRIPALDFIQLKGMELDPTLDYRLKEGGEIILEPVAYDADEETSIDFYYSGWKEDEDGYYDLDERKFVPEVLSSEADWPKEWTTSKLHQEEYPSANYTTEFKDIGYHDVTILIKDRQGLEDYQIVKILVQDKPRFDLEGYNDFYPSYKEYYASTEDPYTLKAIVQCIFCEARDQYSKLDLHYRFYKTLTDDLTIDDDDFYYGYESEPYREFVSKDVLYRLDKDIDDPFSIPFIKKNDQARLFLSDVVSYEATYKDLNVFQCWPEVHEGAAPYPYHDLDFCEVDKDCRLSKSYQKQNDVKFSKKLGENEVYLAPNTCCELKSGKIEDARKEDWIGGEFEGVNKKCFHISYDTCNPKFLFINKEDDAFYSRAKMDMSLKYGKEGQLKSYLTESEFGIPVKLITGSSTDPIEGESDIIGAVSSDESLNDIYTRTFTQKCSGTRGNACAGLIDQTFELADNGCTDKADDEDETCFGPIGTGVTTMDSCSGIALSCQLYPRGSSFEKDFLKCNDYKSLTLGDTETTCNGVCNEHPGRASVEPPKFKPDGNWMCQAQCGNGGCNYPNKENCICDKPNTPCYGLKLGDDITLYDSECNTNPGKCRAVHCEQEIPVCPP